MDIPKIRIWGICLLIAAFTRPIQAQDYIDLVSLSYATTPSNEFKTGGQSTKVRQFDANVDLPIIIDENRVLLTGFSAQTNSLLLDPSFTDKSTVGSFLLKLGVNLVHSEKLSGTYMLIPRLSSDYGKIHGKDLQLGALALLKLTKTERFNYKIGIYVNTEKFGLFVAPLLGFYYKSQNEKFEMNVLLPASADMNYRLFNNIFAGMYFESLSGSYYLNNGRFDNAPQYVNKSSNDLYLYLGIPLTKSLLLKPKIGFTVGRKYRTYGENDKVSFSLSSIYVGDDRTQLNQDFSDGLVAKLELLYRFHFKK
tara:strand:- start:118 stop:1044 length:927 start_codon:yes stop_codon:yes gene_type:complete